MTKYENGDILYQPPADLSMVYIDGDFYWCNCKREVADQLPRDHIDNSFEVVGNIFDVCTTVLEEKDES